MTRVLTVKCVATRTGPVRSYSNKHGVVGEVSDRTMLHDLLNTHV